MFKLNQTEKTSGCQRISSDQGIRTKYLLVCVPKNSRGRNISTEMLGAIKRCNNFCNFLPQTQRLYIKASSKTIGHNRVLLWKGISEAPYCNSSCRACLGALGILFIWTFWTFLLCILYFSTQGVLLPRGKPLPASLSAGAQVCRFSTWASQKQVPEASFRQTVMWRPNSTKVERAEVCSILKGRNGRV